jgi:hypothetical protein
MKALDTNVLVYAEIVSLPHHRAAKALLKELVEGPAPWAIPWPCVYEFLRVVTHPRVFHPPVPLDVALADVNAILGSPTLLLLSETARHREILDRLLQDAGATGNLIHDAHIAALCLEHGVSELMTGDRDFRRFESLSISNPFT